MLRVFSGWQDGPSGYLIIHVIIHYQPNDYITESNGYISVDLGMLMQQGQGPFFPSCILLQSECIKYSLLFSSLLGTKS